MLKKTIGILMCAAVITVPICGDIGSVMASAEETYTYYFLAPDSFCKTEAGADSTSVGAFWWEPSQPAEWPGVEMTPAFEVGENIFKIEDVSPDTTNIIFNSFTPADNAYQTVNISTEGYMKDEAYEGCPVCGNFNGMIYVLDMNCNDHLSEYIENRPLSGAWFTLDSYKSSEKFYGSYEFGKVYEKSEDTDSETSNVTEPGSKKYRNGDKVTAVVTIGGIVLDGSPAKLGAYNYDITYDADAANVVSCTDKTTGGSFIVNPDIPGEVKLSEVAALGVAEDLSGEKMPAAEVVFEVTKDTDSLGIRGVCSSLSVVSMDGLASKTLVGVYDPTDIYTQLIVDGTPVTNSYDPSVKPETPNEDEPDSMPSQHNGSPKAAESIKTDTDGASDHTAEPASANSSANGSKVTSPKTGVNAAVDIVPIMLALIFSAALAAAANRRKAE